jgi:sigma-B regulation protein RsbU (phosphoserine phosphatase)
METRQQKEKLDRELEIAKEIQQLLFPPSSPKIKGFDLSYMNQAATEVGGDYFDFIPIDNNRIGIVIADVSGKGVPGALIMTMVRSIMRSIAPGNLSSRAVLCEINNQISKDLKPDMFITMLYMILDSHNRILTLARAGHDPLVFYHAKEKKNELIKGKGMGIGIVQGKEFEDVLEERVIKLESNDVVCIYTDGATEAKDTNGKEFGKEGLCDAVSVAASGSAQSVVSNIRQRIYRFTGGSPQHDDLTLLVLKALP